MQMGACNQGGKVLDFYRIAVKPRGLARGYKGCNPLVPLWGLARIAKNIESSNPCAMIITLYIFSQQTDTTRKKQFSPL